MTKALFLSIIILYLIFLFNTNKNITIFLLILFIVIYVYRQNNLTIINIKINKHQKNDDELIMTNCKTTNIIIENIDDPDIIWF